MRVLPLCVLCFAAACSRPAAAPPFAPLREWKLQEPLGGLDLSGDGQAVVLGSSTGESSLWTAPWKLSVPFDRMDGRLIGASFTSEGYVLLMRDSGLVELRSSSGAAIQEIELPLPRRAVRARASGGGQHVAFDGALYQLDAQKLVATSGGAIAFAGDHVVVMASASEPVVTARDLRAAGGVREFRAASPVSAVAVSLDGAVVAAATSGGVSVWAGDAEAVQCERSSGAVSALRLTRSARWLVYVTDEDLRAVDVPACRDRRLTTLAARPVALDLDDDLIAVGDERGDVVVYDLFNDRLAARGQVVPGAAEFLRVHAGTRTVLCGSGRAVKLLGLP